MAFQKGWLEVANGDQIAPSTLATEVVTSDSSTVQAKLDAIPSTYETQSNAAATYATKTEVSNIVSAMHVIVPFGQNKPTTGAEGTVYMVQKANGGTVYDLFVWENNDYVAMGSTAIDLTNYVQKLASSPAGTTGESADKTLTYGGTFKVHELVVNADGQVTSAVEKILTMPATDNTVGVPVVENNGSVPSNLENGGIFFRKAASA